MAARSALTLVPVRTVPTELPTTLYKSARPRSDGHLKQVQPLDKDLEEPILEATDVEIADPVNQKSGRPRWTLLEIGYGK